MNAQQSKYNTHYQYQGVIHREGSQELIKYPSNYVPLERKSSNKNIMARHDDDMKAKWERNVGIPLKNSRKE